MLEEEIKRIRNIPEKSKLNEKTIQIAIVLPILRALGWNTAQPDEVILEYSVGRHKPGAVDLALMSRGGKLPLAFIEVKAASTVLQEPQRNQLLDYCIRGSVRVGVLTNGTNWEFFYIGTMSERQHKIPDPPLPALEVNIDEDIDRITQDFTLLLAQNSMNSKKSLKKLQKATQEKSLEHQKRSLKHVWTGLLLNKKDSRIARLVRKELIKQTRISLSVKQCQQFIADQASKNLVTKPGKPELGYEYEYKSVARTTARKPTYIVVFGERITVNKWTELKIYFLSVLISKYPKTSG